MQFPVISFCERVKLSYSVTNNNCLKEFWDGELKFIFLTEAFFTLTEVFLPRLKFFYPDWGVSTLTEVFLP